MNEKQLNLKEIFMQLQYKRMTPYQKEIFVIGLFHSKNFNLIRKEERKLLLKELVSILLMKYKCNFYRIVILSNAYKLDEELFDMATDVFQRKIYVRKSFLEDGMIQNGKDSVYYLDFLNVYLLDCIYHEIYHIISRNQMMRKSASLLDREFVEQLLWCLTLKQEENISMMEQIGKIENQFLEENILAYRMIPEEYYAHIFAYKQVVHAFLRNVSFYGEEKNLKKYQLDVEWEKRFLTEEYNHTYKTNYTFEEIYDQVFLMNAIRFSAKDEEEIKEVYQKLKKKKHFIKMEEK